MYTYYEGPVRRAGALRLCPHGFESHTETQKRKREGQNPSLFRLVRHKGLEPFSKPENRTERRFQPRRPLV